MKREDYIFAQAKVLRSDIQKRNKLNEKIRTDLSLKQRQKIATDLNFLSMEIGKTEERLKFALGAITADEVMEEWRPSGFHVYPGIKNELEKTVFE